MGKSRGKVEEMRSASSHMFLKLCTLVTGSMFVVVRASMAEPSQIDEVEAVSLPTPTSAFINTADLVVATAEEVVTDVQSVLFSPRFQRGEIQGYPYVLFANGTAKVYDATDPQDVLMTMRCSEGVSCVIEGQDSFSSEVRAIGAPKPNLPLVPDAPVIAEFLAQWILSGTGTPPVQTVAPREDTALVPIETLETDTVDAADIEPPEALLVVSDVVDEQPDIQIDEDVAALPEAEVIEQQPNDILDGDCPEQGQFVPNACAQPTSSPIVVSPITRFVSPSALSTEPVPDIKVEPVPVPSAPVPLSFGDQYRLRCSLTGSTTVNYKNAGGQTQGPGKPRVSLGCSASLTENFSVRVAFIRYVFDEQQTDFDPDFTYAFTYRINDKISLGYSNYAGRFSAPNEGLLNALVDGNLRANLRLPKFTLPNDKSIACSTSLGLPDPRSSSFNLSCGYSVTSKLRIGGTAIFYVPGNQGEFDPDFSYTASYRVDENWLLSYSNYSNNRWSWNSSDSPGPGFGGGTLSATYSFKF